MQNSQNIQTSSEDITRDLLLYILFIENKLSRSSLCKTAYLIDYYWKKANQTAYTPINWQLNSSGPVFRGIDRILSSLPEIVKSQEMENGKNISYYRYVGPVINSKNQELEDIIDLVLEHAQLKNSSELLNFIQETYNEFKDSDLFTQSESVE